MRSLVRRIALLATVAVAMALPAENAHTGDDDDLAWAEISRSGSTTGSGNMSDWKTIGRLQKRGARDVMYVRLDDRRYTISDPEVRRRVDELCAPAEKAGRRQESINREQERLSKALDDLDERQSALEARVEAIEEKVERLAESGRREEARRLKEDLRKEKLRFQAQMRELAARMEPLQMEEAELDRRQEELDREQERLYQIAVPKIRVVLSNAIDRGLGVPIR